MFPVNSDTGSFKAKCFYIKMPFQLIANSDKYLVFSATVKIQFEC